MKGLVLIDPVCDRPRRPAWSSHPAALAPIANRPLITHAIDALLGAGADEVAVVCRAATTPWLRSATEGQAPAEVRWIPSEGSGDVARAILAAEGFLGRDRFAVHTTGGLWLQDRHRLVEALRGTDADALLFLVGVEDGDRSPQPVAHQGARRPRLPSRPGADPAFGVACFGPALLDALREPDGEPSFAAALDALAEGGGRVEWSEADGWCPFRDSAEDLLALNRIALDELTEAETGTGADRGAAASADSRIEGCVGVHPTARVSRAVIRGPVLIGAGARVADSYIGPHTVLGETSVVENAEIESSVLLAGARVQNAGVRIESSLIGQGAWVGRTFALPRALRLIISDDASVELC